MWPPAVPCGHENGHWVQGVLLVVDDVNQLCAPCSSAVLMPPGSQPEIDTSAADLQTVSHILIASVKTRQQIDVVADIAPDTLSGMSGLVRTQGP